MKITTVNCVFLASIYLLHQFPIVHSSPVTSSSRPAETVHNRDDGRDSDLVTRVRRKTRFDWQKDESAEEEDEAQDRVTMIPAYVIEHSTPPNDMMAQNISMESNETDIITDTLEHQYRSDIKAILWTNDREGITSKSDPKGTAATESIAHLQNNSVEGLNHRTNTETESATENNNDQVAVIDDTDTVTLKGSSAVPDVLPDADKLQSHVYIHSKLSVNEDRLRTFTLASHQKYGVGRAKPKHITAQLSKVDVVEYNDEEHGKPFFDDDK